MPPLAARLAISRFLDPVLLALVAFAIALWLHRRGKGLRALPRREQIGRGLAWLTWASLWVLSCPFVSNRLNASVEMRGPDLSAALAGADPARSALVVLAGGMRTFDTSIPPRERLDAGSTARVLGASRLYHDHAFGTVVLTGSPAAETEAMADLITTLGVPADRIARDSRALNTRDNAEGSARILRERGIQTVVVTTSANHLRRAVREFQRAGVTVIPAAVDITGTSRFGVDQLLPSSTALATSHMALHEVLGYLRP